MKNVPCAHHLDSLSAITTYSGRHIDLRHPDPAQIVIDDIAAALSRTARFVGHTSRTYTVAEHLLLGLEFCTPAAGLRWFTHDFAEAYLGDVSGPLKNCPEMNFYRGLERAWDEAICERFGVTFSQAEAREAGVVDARMLMTEMRDLKGRRTLPSDPYRPYTMQIPATEPSADYLRERFVAVFQGLTRQSKTRKA